MPKELGDLDELDPKAKPTTLSLPRDTRQKINSLRSKLSLSKAAHVVVKAVDALDSMPPAQSSGIDLKSFTESGFVAVHRDYQHLDFSALILKADIIVIEQPDPLFWTRLYRHKDALTQRMLANRPTFFGVPIPLSKDTSE